MSEEGKIRQNAGPDKCQKSKLWCNYNQFLRLNKSSTKSFIAKTADNAQTPKDSLDVALNSRYDHHNQWWASKHIIVLQKSTNTESSKRKEHRPPDSEIQSVLSYLLTAQELGSSSPEYRNYPNHVSIGISSPHLSNSRRGFGRSADGLFYNI